MDGQMDDQKMEDRQKTDEWMEDGRMMDGGWMKYLDIMKSTVNLRFDIFYLVHLFSL